MGASVCVCVCFVGVHTCVCTWITYAGVCRTCLFVSLQKDTKNNRKKTQTVVQNFFRHFSLLLSGQLATKKLQDLEMKTFILRTLISVSVTRCSLKVFIMNDFWMMFIWNLSSVSVSKHYSNWRMRVERFAKWITRGGGGREKGRRWSG